MSEAAQRLHLPAPDFNIDENDKNLELWTFRLPTNVPLSSLNNVVIDLGSNNKNNGVAKFSANGQDYQIILGDTAENETFRALMPKPATDETTTKNGKKNKGDDDSDSDSDDSDKDSVDEEEEAAKKTLEYLQPTEMAFAKHFAVISAVQHLSESQVAPREGPPPADIMRHAYAHVPQRTGMKRRWMPSGVADPPNVESKVMKREESSSSSSNSIAKKEEENEEAATVSMETESSPPPTKRIKADPEKSEQQSSSKEEKKARKEEKKSKKAEKKALKKSKKESKKIKKEDGK